MASQLYYAAKILPLMVIIAMVFRIIHTADVNDNITFGQFTGVTCPTYSSKVVSKKQFSTDTFKSRIDTYICLNNQIADYALLW